MAFMLHFKFVNWRICFSMSRTGWLLSNYIIDMLTTWFHKSRIPNSEFLTNFAPIRTSLISSFICCYFSSKQRLNDWWKFGIRNRKFVKGCGDQLINIENRYCNIVLAFLFLQHCKGEDQPISLSMWVPSPIRFINRNASTICSLQKKKPQERG